MFAPHSSLFDGVTCLGVTIKITKKVHTMDGETKTTLLLVMVGIVTTLIVLGANLTLSEVMAII